MTLIGKNEKLKKGLKKTFIGVATLATLSGTFYNSEGVPPIYTRKTGDSGGICVGLMTRVEPDVKYHGIILSLYNRNAGTINGIDAAFVNVSADTAHDQTNGIKIGILASGGYKVNGANIGVIVSIAHELNGVGVGLLCGSGAGRNIGIGGLIGEGTGISRVSIGVGYNNRESENDK